MTLKNSYWVIYLVENEVINGESKRKVKKFSCENDIKK